MDERSVEVNTAVIQKRFYSKRTKYTALFITIILPCMLIVYTYLMTIRPALPVKDDRTLADYLVANSDLLLALLFMVITTVPFLLVFDKKRAQARDMVPIALMSAMGIVGRAAFSIIPLPNFKPVTAIIIMTAVAFGPEAGYLTGALTAFLSNFLFGQGPWTPWQMFCWALIGFFAGVLKNTGLFKGIGERINGKEKIPWTLCVYGGIASLAYGAIMDVYYIVGYIRPINLGSVLLAYSSGLFFDLSHAACTVIVLALVGNSWVRRLLRIKRKFGLIGEEYN